MASREMIDVLQRLRELDEKNPNVIKDALENTEKMNPPVEEAKKAKPDFLDMDKDGDKKEPMKKAIKDKKKKMDESITITADSPEDLPVLQQIMKLAGMTPVTPDMMPDQDNVPVMKKDGDCGTPTFDNTPDEQYKGVEDITTQTGYGDTNGPKHPQDLRVKDPTPYGDFKQRLAKLAGIENEEIEEGIDTDSAFNAIMKKDPGDEGIGYVFDKFASKMTDQDADELAKKLGEFYPEWYEQHYQEEETDEGYANSMGNEKDEPTYKGYDPEYSDHTEDGKPKVRYVPSRYGDNPLESIENDLMKEYQEYVKTKETKE